MKIMCNMATTNLRNFELEQGVREGRVFRQLPTNVSKVNKLICNSTHRSGYFCADEGLWNCSVQVLWPTMCSLLCLYMAYIALYLLLEVGFSTLFFVLVFAARINVNSGKWICFAFTAMLWLENWLTACYLRLLFRETLLLPCSCSQLMEYGTWIFSGE